MPIKDFNFHELSFEALSNETMPLVQESVRTRPRCVRETSEDFGFEQKRASHGLKYLYNCGFVGVKRKGKKRTYSPNNKTVISVFGTFDKHVATYGQRLTAWGTLTDAESRTVPEVE